MENTLKIVTADEKIVRTIEDVTAELKFSIGRAKQAFLDIGRCLAEAKSLIPHGEWEDYLQRHTEFSQTTAGNLMRVYKEFGAGQQSIHGNIDRDLSFSQCVALLAVPVDERAAFVEETGAENMSVRELKDAIKAREDAESELDKSKSKIAGLQRTIDNYNVKVGKLNNKISEMEDAQTSAEPDPELLENLDRLRREAETANVDRDALVREIQALRAKPTAAPDDASERALRKFHGAVEETQHQLTRLLEKAMTIRKDGDTATADKMIHALTAVLQWALSIAKSA